MATTIASRSKEYKALWASMVLRPERKTEVTATARRIVANRARYEAVSATTGAPWYVIGILHAMESGLSFKTHLHNGDPLTDKKGAPLKTVQVPKGRGPFATWEESAADALRYDGLDRNADWSIEGIAYCLEKFNGFGSYRKGVPSAYLWSFTTAYERGKYVADGVWSPTAVSAQPGGMALLRALIDANEIDDDHPRAEVATWPKAEPPKEASSIKEAAKSKSVWALLTGAGAFIADKTGALFSSLPDVVDDVRGQLDPVQSLFGMLKLNLSYVLGGLTIACILFAMVRHTNDKKTISQLKGDAK